MRKPLPTAIVFAVTEIDMPHFLLFYGMFIVAVWMGARFWLRAGDSSKGVAGLEVPAEPDPYKIAYLRGGREEVARLMVFKLVRRGYLKRAPWTGSGFLKWEKIFQAEGVSPQYLSELESRVYNQFNVPRGGKEILDRVPNIIQSHCNGLRRELEREGFLSPSELIQRDWFCGVVGGLMVVSVGGLKLAEAWQQGPISVAILILMGIVGVAGLGLLCFRAKMTIRGRRYLDRLQRAFVHLKNGPESHMHEGGDAMVLAVGVFGVSVLAETEYAYLNSLWEQASYEKGSVAGGTTGCGSGGAGGCGMCDGGCGICGGGDGGD